MAATDKKITDLQLVNTITDSMMFPIDNAIVTYRATMAKLLEYVAPSIRKMPIQKIAATGNVVSTARVVLCDATAASFTVTIPSGFNIQDSVITFKKTDFSFKVVTIAGTGLANPLNTLNSYGEQVDMIYDTTLGWFPLRRIFDTTPFAWTSSTGFIAYARRQSNGLFCHLDGVLSGGLGGTFTPDIPGISDGLTIAVTGNMGGSNPILGEIWAITSGSNQRWTGSVVYNNSTSMVCVGPSSAGGWGPTIPGTFGAGDSLDLKYFAPITGWNG